MGKPNWDEIGTIASGIMLVGMAIMIWVFVIAVIAAGLGYLEM